MVVEPAQLLPAVGAVVDHVFARGNAAWNAATQQKRREKQQPEVKTRQDAITITSLHACIYVSPMHIRMLYSVPYIRVNVFVCLFGFNVALKHLRSYHDGACL